MKVGDILAQVIPLFIFPPSHHENEQNIWDIDIYVYIDIFRSSQQAVATLKEEPLLYIYLKHSLFYTINMVE